MTTTAKDFIFSIILCLVWIVFAPFMYFYTFGLAGTIIVVPYILFGLVLTILWILRIARSIKQKPKQYFLLILIQIIPFISFKYLSDDVIMEQIDWKFNYKARMDLIEKIESGKVKPINGKIKSHHFPPISNGGNEVIIYQDSITKKIVATFFINRGYVDHYSAFIYSSIPKETEWYNNRYIKNTSLENIRISENWFRIKE